MSKPKTLQELLSSKKPIHELLRELSNDGITLANLIKGDFSREEVIDYLQLAGSLKSSNYNIFVIEPEGVDSKGRPVRLIIVPETNSLDIPSLTATQRWHSTREITDLIPDHLASISIVDGKIKVSQKNEELPELNNPERNPIVDHTKKSSLRRVNMYDAVLATYLIHHREAAAHLIELIDDEGLVGKEAIEGRDAIIREFEHGEALLAYGVKKVHTIESWLKEALENRLKIVRKDIREFWSSQEGQRWTEKFLKQDFSNGKIPRHEDVPTVLRYVLKHPVEGREPAFLVRSIAAGKLGCNTDLKKIYIWWGRRIRDFGVATEIKFVREGNYLTYPHVLEDVFHEVLTEFIGHPDKYNDHLFRTVMQGIYASGNLLKQGKIPSSRNLYMSYITPGTDIINNKEALDEIVLEILKGEAKVKNKDTSISYVTNELSKSERRSEITGLVYSDTPEGGRLIAGPIGNRRLKALISRYIKLERLPGRGLDGARTMPQDKITYGWESS